TTPQSHAGQRFQARRFGSLGARALSLPDADPRPLRRRGRAACSPHQQAACQRSATFFRVVGDFRKGSGRPQSPARPLTFAVWSPCPTGTQRLKPFPRSSTDPATISAAAPTRGTPQRRFDVGIRLRRGLGRRGEAQALLVGGRKILDRSNVGGG